MSNFDDWGAENRDWGSSEGNSDFEFNWDPEGNFQHMAPTKKSRKNFLRQQPLWVKVVSGAGLGLIVMFVFLQAGGLTKLRTLGLFRESISPEAMCLNGLQVATEMSLGAFNAVMMNQAIGHADRVKSQRSGDPSIDQAAWAIADSAYLVRDVVESIPDAVSSADMMLGDTFDALNSKELQAATRAVTDAAEQLDTACGSLAEDSTPVTASGVADSEPVVVDTDPIDTPEAPISVAESSPSDRGNGALEESNASVRSLDGSEFSFLTFNVCHSQCKDPAPSWEIRRDRIAKVIVESDVDVVGLQEVTNWKVKNSRTEWEDIQQLVKSAGLIGPEISESFDECVKSDREECVDTARILFDTTRLDQMQSGSGEPAAGYSTLGAIVPGIDVNARNRTVAWAYLMDRKDSGFLAISLHMDADKSGIAEESRIAIADGLNSWIAELNQQVGIDPAAVILMADLNSYEARQPLGAQSVLIREGWSDAWSAKDRRNEMFSTINITPDTQQFGGWPPRPRLFSDAATRIDYIFVRGDFELIDYEVLLWLTESGQFDTNYQASDHQSVRATLLI